MILVILNSDSSVNAVIPSVEEAHLYPIDPELGMTIVEMPQKGGKTTTEDYKDYFVINGKWVHFDEIDIETLGHGIPPKLKGE